MKEKGREELRAGSHKLFALLALYSSDLANSWAKVCVLELSKFSKWLQYAMIT